MSPSGPSIIPPEVPVTAQKVQTAQPPRVDTEGPIYNLISRGKKNPSPHYTLTAQFKKIHEANVFTHQIYAVAQEYRHLIKVPDKFFGKDSLQMNWDSDPSVSE